MIRNSFFLKASLMFLLVFTSTQTLSEECDWRLWQEFKENYIVEGGRVLDGTDNRRITTSEGQSYALFFALVANDKKKFKELFDWTEQHLFKGDMTARLPAWLWGKKQSGEYGILDTNSASDSDLWIAYTLSEAGRLWNNYKYKSIGYQLANRILREETVKTADNEIMLLPGAIGFTQENATYELNPSYVPLQIIEYFSHASKNEDWKRLKRGSVKLINGSLGHGFSPDWVLYHNGKFSHGKNKSGYGSYNAIRTYLWAGMLSPEDANYTELLENLRPIQKIVEKQGLPPEKINTITGQYKGVGPSGFSAALVPLLSAIGDTASARKQYYRALYLFQVDPNNYYYDNVLTLFGTAWMENRYKFSVDGRLVLSCSSSVNQWRKKCQ